MLALVIFLSVVIIATTVIFAIRLLNVTNSIDDLTARVNMLHDKYCNHEDRIDCNYKSLAELNRRQDEWMRQHTDTEDKLRDVINQLGLEIVGLQEYNKKREAEDAEAVAELEKALKKDGIAIRHIHVVGRAEKAAKKAKPATERPATDLRPPSETADTNRHRFADLRKTMSMHEAQVAMGISRTTARRYEQWYKGHQA